MTGVKEDVHMHVCHVLRNLVVGATTLAVILRCTLQLRASLALVLRVAAITHVSILGSEMIAIGVRFAILTERLRGARFQRNGLFCHGPTLLLWNAPAWPCCQTR